MSRDPLEASIPAQMAMATAIAAQIKGTTTAWPWLEKAEASPGDLRTKLLDLERSLRDGFDLASALADSDRDAYFDAAPVLARVYQWRTVMRQRLRSCDGAGGTALDAARELRAIVDPDPIRLRGALVMLPRVVTAFDLVLAVLPAEVHAAETRDEATALHAELLRCEATRRAHDVQQKAADADVKRARSALVAHLREVRRKWRLADSLSGGELPPLNVSAGAAEK